MAGMSTGGTWTLGRRPALDGVRAIAFGAVFLSHSGVASFRGGGIGVLVFFVLSGFLITTLLLDERDRTGTIRFGRFYLRRSLRLFPALVLMLSVTAYLVGGPGLWSALLYVANWQWFFNGTGFDVLGVYGHTWSLSVEEQFYLVWPVTVLCCLNRVSERMFGWGLAIASVAVFAVRAATIHNPGTAHLLFGTHAVADQLMIGALLAVLLRVAPSLVVRLSRFAMAAVLTLVAAALVMRPEATGGLGVFSNTLAPTLVAVAAGVVVGRVVTDAGWLTRALSLRPLTFLGRISYGLYLWHVLALVIVGRLLPGAEPASLRTMAALVLTMAAASLSYFLWEQPFLQARAALDAWYARRAGALLQKRRYGWRYSQGAEVAARARTVRIGQSGGGALVHAEGSSRRFARRSQKPLAVLESRADLNSASWPTSIETVQYRRAVDVTPVYAEGKPDGRIRDGTYSSHRADR